MPARPATAFEVVTIGPKPVLVDEARLGSVQRPQIFALLQYLSGKSMCGPYGLAERAVYMVTRVSKVALPSLWLRVGGLADIS